MPLDKRTIDEQFMDNSPSIVKFLKTFIENIKSLFKKKKKFYKLQRAFDRLYPSFEETVWEVLINSTLESSYWYATVRMPFRFDIENRFIEWWEALKQDKVLLEELDLTYLRVDETTSTYKQWVPGYTDDDTGKWIDGKNEEIPYATRSYRIDVGTGIDHISFTFDTRVEGTTCVVQIIDEGKEKVDPVMEIVCGEGAQEPLF